MNKDGLGILVGTKYWFKYCFDSSNTIFLIGTSKKDGIAAVEAVFESIREGLLSEGLVDITKEFKFSVEETAARTARNPQTSEIIQVPAGKKVKAKQLKNFKDLV